MKKSTEKAYIIVGIFLVIIAVFIISHADCSVPMYATDPTNPGDNITMLDDKWIGLGASAGRIEFDDQATDYIKIFNAMFGIGGTPLEDLTVYPSAANKGIRVLESGGVTDTAITLRGQSSYGVVTVYKSSAADIVLQGGDNSYFLSGHMGLGTSTPQGKQHLASTDTHGGYVFDIFEATSGTLSGATDTIELNIPSGWIVRACQLHVKTAVVDDGGDNTWSSELNDGAQVEVISAGSAASQDTNVNHLAHVDAGYGGTLTDAETDVLLTPNGGDFTEGEIEAHCLAFGFDTWDNE